MSGRTRTSSGFSLLEVIVAVAIFSTAIVAILGLVGPLTTSTREVLDSSIAARLADGVERELRRGLGFDEIAAATANPNNPLLLYATQDGSRVILHEDRAGIVEEGLLAMAPRDRYFVLFIAQLDEPEATAMYVPLVIRAEWPYAPMQEPAELPASDVSRSGFAFHTAILQ